MDTQAEIVPIHALFAEDGINPNKSLDDDPRELIDSADVILAVDVMTKEESLVYGADLRSRIASGKESVEAVVLRVGLDIETDELERLVALVTVVKGKHDYGP